VNARLTLGVQAGAVVIPAAAVQVGQKGSFVYVLKADQTVEQRSVVTHAADRTEVVVDEGVKAGETVVADGQLGLTDGSRVQVKPAVRAPEPAATAESAP
jgi:multidrug efflux system membrane fusion protein